MFHMQMSDWEYFRNDFIINISTTENAASDILFIILTNTNGTVKYRS